MKRLRYLAIIVSMLIFLSSTGTTTVFAQDKPLIYSGGAGLYAPEDNVDGRVLIKGTAQLKALKLLVIKDSKKEWFDLEIKDGSFERYVYLTKGKGLYTIAVMIPTGTGRYKYGPRTVVNNTKDVSQFLVPSKNIESDDEKIVSLSKVVTLGRTSDIEKARAIYSWVSSNIKYDYDKYEGLLKKDGSLVYGAVAALNSKKGICYDYAALVAALGRASGIEVKLISGYRTTEGERLLHNWNQVFIKEENRWINLDSSIKATSEEDGFDSEIFINEYEI